MSSNPLLLDLYQLTMAQGYWLEGMECVQASYAYSYRENPFGGGFAVFAGIDEFSNYLENWGYSEGDCAWLATLKAADGSALFNKDFLSWLQTVQTQLDVAAPSEGSIVFAGEPLVRVTGPLIVAQLIETALMNRINFETLIATKAARCYIAAKGDQVLEFGLRRAQGPDGGISASRAAYLGGCSATSNLEAARRFGIPVAGTHAHSWVMAHDTEKEAFDAWVSSSPNNSVLLVDTYDSLKGIELAIAAGAALEAQGKRFTGIRLDSGDLAWLSKKARKMLDAAGMTDAKIFASNDLDENTIASLKSQKAEIDSWGVGTNLATGGTQSALGGVYKMTALKKSPTSPWGPKIKVSDQSIKTSTPGLLGVRRYFNHKEAPVGDMIYDLENPPTGGLDTTIIDPADITRQKTFDADMDYVELLQPLFKNGQRVAPHRELKDLRDDFLANLATLDKSHQRFLKPHKYPVGLERGLFEARLDMITSYKGME
ncbi:MAG: nicotinate phosphoribosyltransferase [Coriobacteriia bacterium]|nr:nicotinate phosphoribosyltransferase [Coriobacteriia bacterium]MCL2537020.1 nicotinate phosphoribosyltransferase [Coriobacteriia bacterium]